MRWTTSHAWRLLSVLVLITALPLAVRMALDVGFTWDEQLQREYGDYILAWYRSGFTDTRAINFLNLYLYGGLFELPAQWLVSTGLSPWGMFETRHVLTALLALLACVAAWLTGNRIGGPRAGFMSALALALTPAWLGHGLFNCKDIPFGTAAAFVAYASVRIAMRRGPLAWSDALLAAAAFGAAVGVRPGGMFLASYPLFASYARVGVDMILARREGEASQWQRALLSVTGRWLSMFPVAWLIMLSAWPWAQQEPFTRPFNAAAIAANFSWHGEMLWNGRVIHSDHLPRAYLNVWFKVTMPDFYALVIVCGAFGLIRALRDRTRDLARSLAFCVLLLSVVLPLVGVLVKRPIIYDAHRHFLFVIPSMAMLAGTTMSMLLAQVYYPRWLRAGVAVLLVGLASVTVYDEWSLHPFQYVYFNRLSGGLPRQASRFETDYWGASYREGFEWVAQNIQPRGKRPIKIGGCAGDDQIRYYRKEWDLTKRFAVPKHSEDAEIYLAFTRAQCAKAEGEVLHTVERQGVRLLSVLRRTPRSAPR